MRILSCLLCFCALCILSTSCASIKYITGAYKYTNRALWAPDDKVAFKLMKKAAELGDTEAMIMLGDMYYIGQGTPKDYKEAFKWYKKGAELGCDLNVGRLGTMYYKGEGTLKDPQKAKYWVKKAYDAGYLSEESKWYDWELWKY